MKVIAIVMLAAGMARAQTNEAHFTVLHTLDGQAFTNATVTRMSAAYAIVDFPGGGSKIAFTNLPAEIQRQFGYDQTKAQAELDLQARRKQEARDKLEAQLKATRDAEKDKLFRIVDDKVFPVSEFTNVHGQVSQVLSNGVVLILYDRVARYYPGNLTGNQSAGAFGGAAGGGTVYEEVLGDKTVFIKCPIRGIAEGQDWKGLCKSNGTFSHASIDGTQRVVERFDTGVSSVTKSDVVLQESSPIVKFPQHSR